MRLSLARFSSFQWKKRSPKSTRRRRGRKRRPRGNDLVSFEIPLDLQIEIMTRLPSKSLMRFKCVSKLWLSLIRSRYFTNLYFMAAPPSRSPRLYISLMKHTHFKCDSMEVCDKPWKSLLVSLSSSSSNNAESFDQDFTMSGMGGHDMIFLRGLILYTLCRKACIYNPATRQSLTLPAVKSNIFAIEEPHKYVDYFLGHDPILDQYKVVCTLTIASKEFTRITTEHWVFVLEVGGSWKRIEFNQPHLPTDIGTCINGVIYYMARDIIVSFDVRSEEFSTIQTPHDVSELDDLERGFIEYGGRPAIFDHTHLRKKGMVDLWVLEDGGKWSKKSIVLQPCQMHLVEDIDLTEECTTQNGEVILAPVSPDYVLYYDLQKNDLRKVEIRGIPECRFSNSYYIISKTESIMHLET